MATRQVADVVFCIDASASMAPCLDAVRRHIDRLLTGLNEDPQQAWDVRFDFLAHRASEDDTGLTVSLLSVNFDGTPDLFDAVYGRNANGSADRFFTRDLNAFRSALGRVSVIGDEAPLIALDTALDFPWRAQANCHRVVVMLTDEPLEDGVAVKRQTDRLAVMVEKIQQSRVMLFLVGPESAAFDELCSADKSEYQVIAGQNGGLTDVDFGKMLYQIGKSVSASAAVPGQGPAPSAKRELFGQSGWVKSDTPLTGA